MTIDDILYPFYLEYYSQREGFCERNLAVVEKIFANNSDGGKFWFNYVRAKNGDMCFSVSSIFKNKLIHNHVGYSNKDIALMSIIHALHTGSLS